LSVTPYGDVAEGLVTKAILETAETMSDPADLINQAIETLQASAIDLPAFSTYDRLVNRLRAEVHTRIYNRVLVRVTAKHLAILDALLVKPANTTTTSFNRLKQTPGPATPTTIRLWIERLDWLAGLIDPDPLLEGIAHTKLRQFAAEAAALEVSELLDIAQPGSGTRCCSPFCVRHACAVATNWSRCCCGASGVLKPRPRNNWRRCMISNAESRKH
jgi:hypothetical protein